MATHCEIHGKQPGTEDSVQHFVGNMEDDMTLNEYMASDDSNAFWRLSSGDHQNLLDEAVERMMDAREALVAVLCDPEGNVCIQGSDADRDVVRKALDTLSVANATDHFQSRSEAEDL